MGGSATGNERNRADEDESIGGRAGITSGEMFERAYKRSILTTACLTILFFPARADAHLVTSGLGPVYDGIGHFFLSPGDALAALALALLAGLRGTAAGRRALFILPMAWLAGGLAGLTTMGWTSSLRGNRWRAFVFAAGNSDRNGHRAAGGGGGRSGGTDRRVSRFLRRRGDARGRCRHGVLQLIGVSATLFVLVSLVSATAVAARPCGRGFPCAWWEAGLAPAGCCGRAGCCTVSNEIHANQINHGGGF